MSGRQIWDKLRFISKNAALSELIADIKPEDMARLEWILAQSDVAHFEIRWHGYPNGKSEIQAPGLYVKLHSSEEEAHPWPYLEGKYPMFPHTGRVAWEIFRASLDEVIRMVD